MGSIARYYGAKSALLCTALIAVSISFVACSPGRAHQNFKSAMQAQVGKDINNPNILRNSSPDLFVNTKILPNGNTEEQFKFGRRLNCRVFIELDKSIGKTVRWRYEGSDEDCVIVR